MSILVIFIKNCLFINFATFIREINMPIALTRIARKFALILNKLGSDLMTDPLLKHPGKKEQYIDPEMTEDLDEVVKDSLHLVILMQRSFMGFMQECEKSTGEKKELGGKLAEQVLFELQEIETNLQSPHLLEFLLNTESGILDIIAEDLGMIRTALNLIKPTQEVQYGPVKMPEAFKDLDQRVFKWLSELEENITNIADQAMGQSDFMEQHFAVDPLQMREQVDTDIDQINREDIHPHHPDFDPDMDTTQREYDIEEEEYENEGKRPHPMDLKNWGQEFSDGVKNFSDQWEPEGDHFVEKK